MSALISGRDNHSQLSSAQLAEAEAEDAKKANMDIPKMEQVENPIRINPHRPPHRRRIGMITHRILQCADRRRRHLFITGLGQLNVQTATAS